MTLFILYPVCLLTVAALALWRPPQMPRYMLLLVIASVPQIGSMFGIWIPGMFLISSAVIVIWCLYNRAVAGTLAVAGGVLLNMLVLAFHDGAMPVRADLLAGLGWTIAPGSILIGSKVVVQSSTLELLSDWIVLSFGSRKLIVSPGDLVVLSGIAWWLLFSHRSGRDQHHAPRSWNLHDGRAQRAPAAGAE